MRLAIVVREYLWAIKKSQRAFAAETGLTVATAHRFLKGEKGADGRTVATILRWLLEETPDEAAAG